MGNAYKGQGKLEEAVEVYSKALNINPDYAEAFYNIGNTLQEQGKFDEAITSYNKALAIKPDYAEAYNNMGITLKKQGKLEEAVEAYRKALNINPDYADAHNNMGNALQDQGKLEEAITSYNKVLSLKPDDAEAYNNMGNTLQKQGKLEEAIEAYRKALLLKPDYAEAYTNMGLTYLCKGSLEEGFKFNEWRSRKRKRTVAPARANFIWDGKQSLNNKRFVAYEEQGLGDMIQFCRYLPFLEQKGADVIFKVTPALHNLLQTMNSGVTLSTTDADEGQIDFEAPLMSLPHLFKTHLKTIPSMNPYLYADHDRIKTWAERLHTDRFKIGICWQGSKGKIDVGRSFPLSLFEGISKAPNVELISLHKGEGELQIKDISFDLTTLGADFDVGQDAFLDTAAVMMNCDLIITSDTAIAHLAGALGCQTWVALKNVPDWRWMLDRSDSPWYPTMTLYRQKKHGDWDCVFDAINQNLRILLD
jgi:Tfp pilus assembly protein PilF